MMGQASRRDPFARAIRAGVTFAVPFALISFLRVVAGVIRGSAPIAYLVVVPLLGFGLFFLLALVLQVSGAVREGSGQELDVSPWFAWMVSGALAFFFVGLLARGHDVLAEDYVRVGLLSALAWILAVGVAWVLVGLWRRRGA